MLLIGYGLCRVLGGDPCGGLWYGRARLAARLARRAAAIAQSAFTERLEGVTVADIMDAEPVTIPAGPPAAARVRGLLPALPGLGVVRGRRGRRALRRARPPRSRRARSATRRAARSPGARRRRAAGRRTARCRADAPLEALLGLRAAAPPGRADGGRRRRPPARRRHARAGLARAARARLADVTAPDGASRARTAMRRSEPVRRRGHGGERRALRQERVDDGGANWRAGVAAQLRERGGLATSPAGSGAVGRHRREGVADEDDLRAERDRRRRPAGRGSRGRPSARGSSGSSSATPTSAGARVRRCARRSACGGA